MSKPLISFQSVHLRTVEQARLFAVSHALIERLNPGIHCLIMDNASPLDPMQFLNGSWDLIKIDDDHEVPTLKLSHTIVRFKDSIGHFSYAKRDENGKPIDCRDGPMRAVTKAIEIGIASGYERAVYQETDALCSLPYSWWFERMTKPVACQPVCRHGFTDWNVWPMWLGYMQRSDFVGQYDWRNRDGTEDGEIVVPRILGDNVEIIPVRGERWEFDLSPEQFRRIYAGGCDLITHVSRETHAAFLEMSGHSDLVGLLGKDWNGQGVALAQSGHFTAAAAALEQAIADDPERGDYHANIANVYRRLWRFEDAAKEITLALKLGADTVPTGFIAGCLAADAGQPGEAVRWFDKVLAWDAPHYLRTARAYSLLASGQWARGFREFESRIESTTKTTLPIWDGSPGKTVAIHHEQGFGDTIMASRFLRQIPADLFKRVYFGVPGPLLRLFEGQDIGPCELLSMNQDMPEVDAVLPLMSLPDRLGVETVASPVYLTAKHAYSIRRPPGAKLAIGLVWRSKAQGIGLHFEHALHGEQKSIPLELLLPLAGIPGIALYGLQTGDAAADIDRLGAASLIDNLGPKILDFADLAGFVAGLDMVISVDTAPAHLAGALGKPTIVLLNTQGSWQWGTGDRSPWYGDNLQVVRQPKPHDWQGAVEQVRAIIEAA